MVKLLVAYLEKFKKGKFKLKFRPINTIYNICGENKH